MYTSLVRRFPTLITLIVNLCPARYFSIKYPDFTPKLSSPREAPQVDHTGLPTFPANYAASMQDWRKHTKAWESITPTQGATQSVWESITRRLSLSFFSIAKSEHPPQPGAEKQSRVGNGQKSLPGADPARARRAKTPPVIGGPSPHEGHKVRGATDKWGNCSEAEKWWGG